jgi:predicted flavoprotein YhiN
MSHDAIILGAGAAGLFCGATAAQRGRRVVVLDHAEKPGKKILISGGGRCNFTNLHTAPDRYLSENRHFARSALSRYTPADFLELVERHGIAWHEKTLGQLFCDGSARQIVAMLLDECMRGGVEVICESPIAEVGHADGRFRVRAGGRTYQAPALVIATGGPAIPQIGASGIAYDLARQFGLKVVQPRPALVPLTLPDEAVLFRELSGWPRRSRRVRQGAVSRGSAVYPSRAFGAGDPSGLVLLVARTGRDHRFPARSCARMAAGGQARASARGAALGSGRGPAGPAGDSTGRATGAGRGDGEPSGQGLARCRRKAGRLGFHAQWQRGVCQGRSDRRGISTADLSSQTMEARKVPGLYAIGEAVDVTGWLGGYNFQWAWASGHAAGQAI